MKRQQLFMFAFLPLCMIVPLLVGCRRAPTAAVPPAPTTDALHSVDVDEIIEMEFNGDPDFDIDLSAGPNPIPAGPDQPTSAAIRQVWHAYRDRDLTNYKDVANDTGAVREAGIAFLEAYNARQVGEPGQLTIERIRELGDHVVELGSQDPAILTCHAITRLDMAHVDGQQTLENVAPQLTQAGYSSLLQSIAYYRLLTVAKQQQAGIDDASYAARQQCIKWVGEEGGNVEHLRIVWHYLKSLMTVFSSGQTVYHRMNDEKKLFDALRNLPQLDTWLTNMLAGKYYADLASHYRGGGTVNWVTEAGAQRHAEFIQLAGKFYTRAWQLRPDFPEAPAAMIFISLTGGDERFSPRGWFDRAVHAEMDQEAAYAGYFTSLQPRWGGSNEATIKFARQCAATKRYDTRVPMWFLARLTEIQSALDGDPDVWNRSGLYNELQAVLDGYEQDGKLAGEWARHLRSIRAALAVKHGDFATARAAFELLGDDIETKPFRTIGHKVNTMYGLTYAMTGGAGETVQKFSFTPGTKTFLSQEAVAEQQSLLAAARQLDDHPASVEYFDELGKLLDWREAFLKGQWVDLTFDEKMLGWDGRHGKYTVEDENTVLVSTLEKGWGIRLHSLLPFEAPFVVEADVEELDPDTIPHVGIFVGKIEVFNSPGRFFWVDRSTRQSGFTRFNQMPMSVHRDFLKVNRLRVSVWPQFYQSVVNHTLVVRPRKLEQFNTDGSLAFGEHMFVGLHGKVRFSRLRIRALNYERPPLSEQDTVASEQHYQAALAFDPDDVFAAMALSELQLDSGRVEAARPHLDKAQELLHKGYWAETGLEYLLGMLQEADGHYAEALEHYEKSYQVQQFLEYSARRLAWIKATCHDDAFRDGKAALNYAHEAIPSAEDEEGSYQAILAAALAEAGQFESAVAAQQEAVAKAPAENLAAAQARLAMYQQKQPYRHPDPAASK